MEKKAVFKKEALFALMAVMAGANIAIASVASLWANFLYGAWGKLIGAILFTFGMMTVIIYECKLYTGMVARCVEAPRRDLWRLPYVFLLNAVGVAFVFLLAYFSPLRESLLLQGKSLIAGKLMADGWALRCLGSSMLCGMLITLSVRATGYAPKKQMSVTLGVLFPVLVFVFCGFDHSVANMFYFYCYGKLSFKVLGYIVLAVVGNFLGGVLLPLCQKLQD